MAQTTLITPGVHEDVRKLVVHDHGDLWPGGLARHADGSVLALGNPWLGGGLHDVASDINDMARLDAFTPGDAEGVAMVGSGGLTLVRWNQIARDFTVTPLDGGALAQNAQMVRAAPFAPHHVIALVTADGSGVRCYRATGTFVAAPPVTGPVLDLDVIRNAAGAARLLIRNAAGITCIDPAGIVQYTVTGSGGVFVRWPQSSSTIRAAWIHHVPSDPDWQLSLLADNGQFGDMIDLGFAFASNEQIVAAFAAKADADDDVDLVVKTSSGVSVIDNQGAGDFTALAEVTVAPLVAPLCVPDLLTTHAGHRLRLVDDTGDGAVSWNRVDVEVDGTGVPDAVNLETFWEGAVEVGASVASSLGEDTVVDFTVRTTSEGIAPFIGAANTWTQMQVVAWRQAQSNPEGRLDNLSESNVMFHLLGELTGDRLWDLDAQLAPDLWQAPLPSLPYEGWNESSLYWLTIRVANTPADGTKPNSASEPVTLVTSMSVEDFLGGWDYIQSLFPGVVLPRFSNYPAIGGGVVGVIQRSDDPPPPPSGIPSPTAYTALKAVSGTTP